MLGKDLSIFKFDPAYTIILLEEEIQDVVIRTCMYLSGKDKIAVKYILVKQYLTFRVLNLCMICTCSYKVEYWQVLQFFFSFPLRLSTPGLTTVNYRQTNSTHTLARSYVLLYCTST